MGSVINLLRTLGKEFLPRLPLFGRWFSGVFRLRKARFVRREKIVELRALRDVARVWCRRIADARACPDNADIPRVPDAGRIVDGNIIMHNGLRVAYGTYGTGDTKHLMQLLEENGGVHEPQEEKVFQQVLPLMPSGAVMLELGAYWGFYSLWFKSRVEKASCFLVEPVWANLNAGRLNFALNGLPATFINGFVGPRYRRQVFRAPVVTVDWLMREHRLEKVHLLHCDVQGYEREVLEGAEQAVRQRRIDWIFISTHSNQLHADCRTWLVKRDWEVVADANLEETHSVDGLLVAHRIGLEVRPLRSITCKSTVAYG
jgi:hypothetical protein